LPIAGQASKAGTRSRAAALTHIEAAAKDASLPDSDVAALQQQGLSRGDAVAALLLAGPGSSADDALLLAATCMEAGGAHKVWKDSGGVDRQKRRQMRMEVRLRGQVTREVARVFWCTVFQMMKV
jgi:hypothetical protein